MKTTAKSSQRQLPVREIYIKYLEKRQYIIYGLITLLSPVPICYEIKR